MEQHFTLTDQEFEQRFANASLDPVIFSHEAHLRLAWIHLTKYGEAKAIQHITAQLQQYVIHLGATEKYNQTLTIAAVKAVWHFMHKQPATSFAAFIANCPRLKTNFKSIIDQHYGFDIFNSAEAKINYLEPDQLAFT